MRRKIFIWVMVLTIFISVFVFAHEKTGWIGPEEAKRKSMKNVPYATVSKGMGRGPHLLD